MSDEGSRRMFSKQRHLPVLIGAMACMLSASAVVPMTQASAWFYKHAHTVNSEAAPSGIAGKTIVVDAGHGGKDSGARGIDGLQEKDITLAVAQRLIAYLHQAGAIVVATRTTDVDLATDEDRANRRRHLGDLRGRMNVVRKQKIDAFVSIHCNAAPSADWHGAQVLYFATNDHAKTLASLMQSEFREELLPTKREIESNRSLYLLKRIEGPTVLAEIGFLTNPQEAMAMRTASYQDKVAFAMYQALVRYFSDPSVAKAAEKF